MQFLFKVLAHMKQQHLLLNTEPIQRSHEEIQPVIDRLMDECFPDYNQKLAVIRKSHVKDDGNGVGKSLSFSIYHCAECHLAVKCVDGREFSPDSGLMTHLQEVHTQNCMPWRCGECNWRSDVEWKVRRHICIRHTDQANTVKVTKDRVPDWKMFIARHFIDLPAVPPNEDEETDEKLDTARVFWDTVVEKTRKRRRLRH
uniref:C2H2-type domain-containing protein n=1 Tax=Caenorhabditis japonica TaxID=281687 RepID=A0A8R1I2E2_CAEJA